MPLHPHHDPRLTAVDEAHAASDEHDHARLLHREASSSATTSVLIYDAHDSTEPGVARLRRMSSSGAPFAPGHDFGQRHDADHDFAEQHRAAMPGQHADDALDARKTLLSPPGAPPILANGKHRDSDASLPTTAVDGTTLARLRTPTNASGAASSTLADDSDRHRQRVHLEEEVYADFSAYIIERRKLFLYYIGVMLTAGILYLAARWSIRFRLWLTARKTTLARATHILAENNWKERAVVQVESVQLPMDAAESVFAALVVDECDFAIDDGNHMSGESPPDQIRRIVYRCATFLLHPRTGRFVQNTMWKDRHAVSADAIMQGLTRDEAHERLAVFDVNAIVIPEKTTMQLLVDEVLHPFYIFQVMSIVLWCTDSYYYYASCIFIISVVSTAATLIETKKNIARLRDMAKHSSRVHLFRSNVWKEVDCTVLVPGDVFEITPDMTTVPCDSVLLTGDALVNESMLTGESVPVAKSAAFDKDLAGLQESGEINSKYYLFGGTTIIRARLISNDGGNHPRSGPLAMVARTGFNTVKGGLLRSMLFPKPNKFQFYEDSFKFIGVLACIALLGFVYTVINFLRHGVGIERLLKKACDLLTIVIPPALPAAMSIGTSFAINRLKRSQIYCISPPRVNVCGKLNAIVFDKTGTLTEDGLDVLGVVPIDAASESFGAMISDIDVLMKFTSAEAPSLPSKSTTLLDALATCHSLNHVRGELVGDPMDLKMFAWTRWSLEEPKVTGDQLATIVHPPRKEPITHECLLQPTGEFEFNASADPLAMDSDELGIIRTFEFVSGLRRMSAIVKRLGENRMHAVVKGAPEVMHDICDPSTLPADYDAVLDYYTRRGYRVLACGTKSLENLSWRHAQKIPRENVESDLRFLGLVVFENKLKRETAPVLGVLQRANIRTLMCTGDNVLTAISVSKECGLVAPHSAVFMPRIHHDPMESLGVKRKRVVWESLDDPTWGLDPHLLVPSMSATAISGTSSKTNSFTRFNEINLSSKLFRTGAPDGAAAAIVDMSAAVTTDPTHNYDLAITGEVFDHLIQHASASTLNRALVKAKVFARMSPEQKLELVERLQDLGYCVSMCGDGANDCAALKSSDAGISLSNAEASVAAPFTSHKQDIECVLEVIRQGRAALVTSFSCFKYMALYSMIQFGSVTLLYSVMANLGDFQFLFIDLFLILPLAIMMGRADGCARIHKKRPTANLMSKKVLTSLIGQVLVQITFQTVLFFNVRAQPWYSPPAFENLNKNNIRSFDCYQYVGIALVLSVGKPYRKSLFRSGPFVVLLITILLLCTYVLLLPDPWTMEIMQLQPIPLDYRLMILGYAAVYFTMAMIGERLAFPAIAKSIAASGMAWRRIRRRSAGYVDLEQGDVSGSLVHYGTAPRLRKNGKPTRKLYKVVLDDMAVIN